MYMYITSQTTLELAVYGKPHRTTTNQKMWLCKWCQTNCFRHWGVAKPPGSCPIGPEPPLSKCGLKTLGIWAASEMQAAEWHRITLRGGHPDLETRTTDTREYYTCNRMLNNDYTVTRFFAISNTDNQLSPQVYMYMYHHNECIWPPYLSPSTEFSCRVGPGRAEHEGIISGETRKRAFRRQMAANSRVGAGIAADWEWMSELYVVERSFELNWCTEPRCYIWLLSQEWKWVNVMCIQWGSATRSQAPLRGACYQRGECVECN